MTVAKKVLYYKKERDHKNSVRFQQVDAKGQVMPKDKETNAHFYHMRQTLPDDCEAFTVTIEYK